MWESYSVWLHALSNAVSLVCTYTGRTARIRGTRRSHLSAILRQAVLYGFDWVIYADRNYCRVSVIPDGKLVNLKKCIYKKQW